MFRLCAAAVLFLSATATAGPDPVDAALARLAEPVVVAARDRGLPSVGVLTAHVILPGNPEQFGTEFGTALARRFEVALVLADPDEDLVILRRPGDTLAANRDRVADHRTPAGRKQFFQHRYAPAWGDPDSQVEAGGFVVLAATVSPKLDSVALSAAVFDKSGTLTDVPGAAATAAIGRRGLAELGAGYRADGGKVVVAGARGVAPEVLKNNLPAQQSDATPGNQPTAASRPSEWLRDGPVRLQVFYNDTEVPVESADGFGRVRTPAKGDKLHFVLTNTGPDPVAAVLKVNGENTIGRGTAADERCRKWVLDPGKPVTIRGYLRDNNREWEAFRVLADAEAESAAAKYGPHAGTFRLAVFAGKLAAAGPDQPADDAALTQLAIARGSVDVGDRPLSLKALKARLRKAGPAENSRGGLVVPGGEVATKPVDVVRFEADGDGPVMNLPVWYADPTARTKVAE